jgi:hypothetical protein
MNVVMWAEELVAGLRGALAPASAGVAARARKLTHVTERGAIAR